MQSLTEKSGVQFKGVKLLLCENPLPPLDEAVQAAQKELTNSNLYTEIYSNPLRDMIAERDHVPRDLIHVNAGSELILRQLFQRYGQQVHLLTPTYPLFPEIAERFTETYLMPGDNFGFDLARLKIPVGTTMAVIVNPNNPNGRTFNMKPLAALLVKYPSVLFLVDEAFIGVAGQTVAHLVPKFENLIVTRTFSKAQSLAGFRIGYAIAPKKITNDLNNHNDAYPLARPSQAAAMATLQHEEEIQVRIANLRRWTEDLAENLQTLGITTYPSEAYFFLADFYPHDATDIAEQLKTKGFLTKPLDDDRLGTGFMRITTSTPENNERFVAVLREILSK